MAGCPMGRRLFYFGRGTGYFPRVRRRNDFKTLPEKNVARPEIWTRHIFAITAGGRMRAVDSVVPLRTHQIGGDKGGHDPDGQ